MTCAEARLVGSSVLTLMQTWTLLVQEMNSDAEVVAKAAELGLDVSARIHTLEGVERHWSIDSVKLKLEALAGIPVEDQLLTHRGQPLDGRFKLTDFPAVHNRSTLMLADSNPKRNQIKAAEQMAKPGGPGKMKANSVLSMSKMFAAGARCRRRAAVPGLQQRVAPSNGRRLTPSENVHRPDPGRFALFVSASPSCAVESLALLALGSRTISRPTVNSLPRGSAWPVCFANHGVHRCAWQTPGGFAAGEACAKVERAVSRGVPSVVWTEGRAEHHGTSRTLVHVHPRGRPGPIRLGVSRVLRSCHHERAQDCVVNRPPRSPTSGPGQPGHASTRPSR